ncbi:MAG: SDR family oxidoreductase [Candidatus Cloacimonadales bacterium]|jgi:NAD(P)-dependent dehydrogenase (short-subunit alcohol dehydrogenase family)|nr:SDR family oxidoreductase [Candidatus Cloacimonadota bacterium]MDD2650346.1 SDR family NAD(P)-dependent oxidoreductase [Candidatus Cloacimonadota bacterium]MDD3501262.1 SDR family NAD(P)-dependent oxidoreductase [Candidatus Cloacimonadota bacterium]MDX9976915.1 SDR family oxidoreductase [Candidatus Cloacimonadales bacterium]
MKKILIIGANSNIGAFLAKQFYNDHELILHYHRNQERIKSLIEGNGVKTIQFDICNYTDIKDSFTKLFSEKKDIPDAVIFCSTERSKDFQKLAESDSKLIDSIINTNFNGLCYSLNILIPFLRKKNGARIVLFGSNVSRIGLKNGSVYAATKAAVSSIARSIAIEEAENNIFINVVSPGPVQIDNSQFSPEYRKFREEYYMQQSEKIPLGRVANFEDIYHTIDFLLFKNSYITGEEIFITGGSL